MKQPLEVKVVWINQELQSLGVSEPMYSVDVSGVSKSAIDFKVSFVEPELVSTGASPDRLTVWFRDPFFFRRESDSAILQTEILT